MSFLLDTDICSAFLKGNSVVWQRCTQYAGQLHVSVITGAELCTWALRASAPSRRIQIVSDFLKTVPVIDVTVEVARQFGQLDAELLDKGQRLPPMDLLIAATALLHGLSVVTHNVQDFSRIPNLSVVDWLIS